MAPDLPYFFFWTNIKIDCSHYFKWNHHPQSCLLWSFFIEIRSSDCLSDPFYLFRVSNMPRFEELHWSFVWSWRPNNLWNDVWLYKFSKVILAFICDSIISAWPFIRIQIAFYHQFHLILGSCNTKHAFIPRIFLLFGCIPFE